MVWSVDSKLLLHLVDYRVFALKLFSSQNIFNTVFTISIMQLCNLKPCKLHILWKDCNGPVTNRKKYRTLYQ